MQLEAAHTVIHPLRKANFAVFETFRFFLVTLCSIASTISPFLHFGGITYKKTLIFIIIQKRKRRGKQIN